MIAETANPAGRGTPGGPPITAVILAGSLRPSPLRRAIDRHVLTLPLGSGVTLLDAWHRAFDDLGRVEEARIVVNSDADAAALRKGGDHAATDPSRAIEVVVEPASWRGSGGLLRDALGELEPDRLLLVVEAACLPPPSLAPLRRALAADLDGLVAATDEDEPTGTYLFRAPVVSKVPDVGYFDMKEQLFPALTRDGLAVGVARFGEPPVRIRDRRSYLDAIAQHAGRMADAAGDPPFEPSPGPSISESCQFFGRCVVEPGAAIGENAILHDAVVLEGASVGEGCIISRSIVGGGARLSPGTRIIDEIRSDSHRVEAAELR